MSIFVFVVWLTAVNLLPANIEIFYPVADNISSPNIQNVI